MDIYQKRIEFWSKFFTVTFSLLLTNFFFIKLYFYAWFFVKHFWRRPAPLVDLAFWVALPVCLALLSYLVAGKVEKKFSRTQRINKLHFYRLSWFNFAAMILLRWLDWPEIEIMLALLITIGFIIIYGLYRNKDLTQDEHDSL